MKTLIYLRDQFLKGWNYFSVQAHIAVIFFLLGWGAAWIIRLL